MPFPSFFRAATLAAMLVPSVASAQIVDLGDSNLNHKKHWDQCTGKGPAVAIKACGIVLKAHLEPPDLLAVAFHARALAYAETNHPDLAMADIDEAIRRRPDYATAHSNRGNFHASLHEYDLAIADFNEALRLSPEPTPYFNPASTLSDRASVYNAQGDYAHALADYDELLRRDPSDAQALFHRGNVYSNQSDYTRALADYDKALAFQPGVTAYTQAREQAALRAGLFHAAPSDVVAACPVPATQTPNYFEDTPDHLRKLVPDLHGLQPEKDDPQQTASILGRTSSAVAAMLPKIPNLVAREEVQLASNAAPLSDLPARTRGGILATGGGHYQDNRDTANIYTYRIVRRTNTAGSSQLDEFRTDAQNRPLTGNAVARNLGFAELWLLVAPANLSEAHFRLLGHQKIAGHETFVLAFAQLPGHIRLGTLVGPSSMRCVANIQGILWVDQAAFHIVHMQTDLLSPVPAIELTQLRSVLRYSEVKIPERALSLWLPTNIEITWNQAHQADTETHRYSRYRLFAGTARIVPITSPSP